MVARATGSRVVQPERPLDGHDVGRALERRRLGLARATGTADRLEEVLEPRRRHDPEHDEVLVALVEDLVPHVVSKEAGGSRDQGMALPRDDHAPSTAEADLELDLVTMRVLADPTARRDGLVAHRQTLEPRYRGMERRVRVAVGGDGLPEGRPGSGLDHDGVASHRLPV